MFARSPGRVGGLAGAPLVDDANIGREAGRHGVPEPPAHLDRGKAGPNAQFGNVLGGEVEFGAVRSDVTIVDGVPVA